jgi:acetyltransferase-like isoleucine patch superfamily enzyme
MVGEFMGNHKSALPIIRTLISRNIILLVRLYYNHVWGTRIGKDTRISLSARIDKTSPAGVVIGNHTALAFEATILTHDFINRRHLTTTIGDYCFIGARAILMPGITVGNHCIIGAGSVVMKDVPPNSVVLGNPGRVLERGIMTGRWGARVQSAATEVVG